MGMAHGIAVLWLLVASASADPLPPDEQQDCLAAWNKYRTQAGMGATTLCSETPQSWANYQAYYDNTYGFHAYCLNQGWNECYKANCGTVGVSCLYPWHQTPGQCEAYGSGQPAFSWDSAVKSFYSEGPGGGHYDVLVSDTLGCIACGKWVSAQQTYYTFNTCCAGAELQANQTAAPPSPPAVTQLLAV